MICMILKLHHSDIRFITYTGEEVRTGEFIMTKKCDDENHKRINKLTTDANTFTQ